MRYAWVTNTEARAETTEVRRRDVGLRSERGPVLMAVMLSTALVALDQTIVSHRGAVDRGGPRRLPAVPVAVLGLPARPGRDRAGLRQARRPVRPQAADVLRHRDVPARVGALRPGVEHAGADRGPWPAGPRRGRRTADRDDRSSATSTRCGSARRCRATSPACGAISSVVGPTIGGVFSQLLSWRFIFWVNIPLCLLAACHAAPLRGAVEPGPAARRLRRRRAADARDDAGGPRAARGRPVVAVGAWQTVGDLRVGGAAARRVRAGRAVRAAADAAAVGVRPRAPAWSPSALGMLVGGLLLGLSSYVPTLGQDVVGASAVVSGFALAALTLGWPVAASVAGRLYLSIGFRATGLLGVCAGGRGRGRAGGRRHRRVAVVRSPRAAC